MGYKIDSRRLYFHMALGRIKKKVVRKYSRTNINYRVKDKRL